MVSLADLLGLQSLAPLRSNGALNMPMGPPWPNTVIPSSSGFPGTAVQPDGVNSEDAFANDIAATGAPPLRRLDALTMRSPPQTPGGILGALPTVWVNGGGNAAAGGMLQQYNERSSGALNASAAGLFHGLPSSYPLSSFDLLASLPVPPPESSWAAPQLPLFPTNVRYDSRNIGQRGDDSAVLSDADPDPSIANAQYASRARRGGRRASEPEPSPAEEIRWTIYNHNLDVLGKLDPQNRLLFSAHDGSWVPSPSHIRMLEEEIERARREQGRSDIEPHHNLPREFEPKFNACGLDIEDYLTYMARDLHRLRPSGLHTGLER